MSKSLLRLWAKTQAEKIEKNLAPFKSAIAKQIWGELYIT